MSRSRYNLLISWLIDWLINPNRAGLLDVAWKWLTFLQEILNRSTVEVINKRPTVSQIDQPVHTDDSCGTQIERAFKMVKKRESI